MLARVAENIYWLSRYLERAENTVRLIKVHSNLLMDMPDLDEHQSWMPLISINGQDEEFAELHDQASETSVNEFLLADRKNATSLVNAFIAIQINLRSCRDILPKNSYESINGLCRLVLRQVENAHAQTSLRMKFLNTVEERLQAISGSLNSNMSHDLAYRFMHLGGYLERADMTSRIIDVQSTRLTATSSTGEIMAIQEQRWVSVLRTLAAYQMYRQQVRRPVNGKDALVFLLTDKHLPRSYAFCLNHLDESLRRIGVDDTPCKAIAILKQQLDLADFDLFAQDPIALHEFLDNLQLGMLGVSAAISTAYFPPPLSATPEDQTDSDKPALVEVSE